MVVPRCLIHDIDIHVHNSHTPGLYCTNRTRSVSNYQVDEPQKELIRNLTHMHCTNKNSVKYFMHMKPELDMPKSTEW